MTEYSSGLDAPQPNLKKNHSSATMATDTSTLALSVVDNLNEKSLGSESASRAVSPIDIESEKIAAAEGEADVKSNGSDSGEYTEDGATYPGPLALGLITMALSLAVFLVALVSFCCLTP